MIEILTSIPHNKHYINRYYKFICQCVANNKSELIIEYHHICPKSLFPDYESFDKYPLNCATLTPRQHYIAHWMLWKAYGGKMAYAFHMMISCNSYTKYNSKSYNKCKIELSNMARNYMLEYNPMNNIESRNKVRLSKLGDKNPNYGKVGTMSGKKHTPESIEKLKYIAKNRQKYQCEYCLKYIDSSNFKQFHGNLCSINPNINPDILIARKLKSKIASDKAKEKKLSTIR